MKIFLVDKETDKCIGEYLTYDEMYVSLAGPPLKLGYRVQIKLLEEENEAPTIKCNVWMPDASMRGETYKCKEYKAYVID